MVSKKHHYFNILKILSLKVLWYFTVLQNNYKPSL